MPNNINMDIIAMPNKTIYGFWGKSGDKTIAKDIPKLSKKYYNAVGKEPGSVLPFYVVTKDYNEKTGEFGLFIGGEIENENIESFCLNEGTYGKMKVKPKLGLLWGAAIGEAKRDFYAVWLPKSQYKALNMEYELHTQESIHKKPYIDLLFAIEKK